MTKSAFIIFTVYILMTSSVLALAGPSSAATKFNFSYVLEGDEEIAPSQIFDDGNKIYLQFNLPPPLPEFYLDDGQGKPSLNSVKSELLSPYVVISTLTPRLHLHLGSHHAVMVNQNLKQPKGLTSITRTLGAIFSSKQKPTEIDFHNPDSLNDENLSLPPTTKGEDQKGAKLIFQVRNRESLAQALQNFLESQGWRLQWNHSEDFIIHSSYVMYGTELPVLVNSVVTEFKLRAKYLGNTVIVSPALP
jgi:Conjugal transfer protein